MVIMSAKPRAVMRQKGFRPEQTLKLDEELRMKVRKLEAKDHGGPSFAEFLKDVFVSEIYDCTRVCSFSLM